MQWNAGTANAQLVNEGAGSAWVGNKCVTPAKDWPTGGDISSAGAGDRTLHGKVARGRCWFFVTWGVPVPSAAVSVGPAPRCLASGGTPSWWRGDEWPHCSWCAKDQLKSRDDGFWFCQGV